MSGAEGRRSANSESSSNLFGTQVLSTCQSDTTTLGRALASQPWDSADLLITSPAIRSHSHSNVRRMRKVCDGTAHFRQCFCVYIDLQSPSKGSSKPRPAPQQLPADRRFNGYIPSYHLSMPRAFHRLDPRNANCFTGLLNIPTRDHEAGTVTSFGVAPGTAPYEM